MAAVYDTVGPSSVGATLASGSTRSLTWAHTCSSSADRLLIVGVAVGANPDGSITTTATYNGTAMASAGLVHSGGTAAGYAVMFKLIAPASGAHDVVVSISGAATLSAGSVSFTAADQTSGVDTVASAYDSSANNAPTLAVPSTTSGNPVIDVLAQGSGSTSAAGSGQTLRWARSTNGSTRAGCGASSTEISTGGTVTMSYTIGAADHWGILAAQVLPAATAPTGPEPGRALLAT